MTTWRKSGRSGGTSTHSDCVELARFPGGVGVRDSKRPEAGHLTLSLEGFAELVTRVRRDELSI